VLSGQVNSSRYINRINNRELEMKQRKIKEYADKSLSNGSSIDLLAGGSRITIHTLKSGSVFVTVYSRIEGKLKEVECVKGDYHQSTRVSTSSGEEHRMVNVSIHSSIG
jgi:hypothetical protein